jgi:hypothetical protein
MRIFYNDNLRVKNNKYCLRRHVPFIPYILNVQKITSNYLRNKFIFMFSIFTTKYIFISVISVSFVA